MRRSAHAGGVAGGGGWRCARNGARSPPNPTTMNIRTMRYGALLLPVLALTACDSGDGGTPANARFEAAVAGGRTASLEGPAIFEVSTDVEGTATAVALVDADDPQDVIAVVLNGAPHTGTFAVTTEEAGALLVLSDGGEGDLYTTTGGTVTISRTTGDRLEGRFEVEAANVLDEADVVTVEGTFRADEGDVADPARAALPRR